MPKLWDALSHMHRTIPSLKIECVPFLQDPIDNVLVRLEETLRRYNVHVRHDFQEILLELILLAFMYDRVANMQWALKNLQHVEGATKAFPPIKHGTLKSLGFKSASWNLEGQFSRKVKVNLLLLVLVPCRHCTC